MRPFCVTNFEHTYVIYSSHFISFSNLAFCSSCPPISHLFCLFHKKKPKNWAQSSSFIQLHDRFSKFQVNLLHGMKNLKDHLLPWGTSSGSSHDIFPLVSDAYSTVMVLLPRRRPWSIAIASRHSSSVQYLMKLWRNKA